MLSVPHPACEEGARRAGPLDAVADADVTVTSFRFLCPHNSMTDVRSILCVLFFVCINYSLLPHCFCLATRALRLSGPRVVLGFAAFAALAAFASLASCASCDARAACTFLAAVMASLNR